MSWTRTGRDLGRPVQAPLASEAALIRRLVARDSPWPVITPFSRSPCDENGLHRPGVPGAIANRWQGLLEALRAVLAKDISKRLGFDPATTAGPFETAFQDVVGFAVFLGLATLLASHI